LLFKNYKMQNRLREKSDAWHRFKTIILF